MVLKEYKQKRDFTRTPEPRPRKGPSKAGWSYLIQKHAATRLHYDFRLELDGVLLSWAVTKGPSLDPKDKRLAVRTEDHPLDYGTFEGTIPKGEYGGGTVMLWDRGTWEPMSDPHAGLESGHLSFNLHGERLKGEWDLVRMHGQRPGDRERENWLLIKRKDPEARTGAAADLLSAQMPSVASGRSMTEIEGGQATVIEKQKSKRIPKAGQPKPASASASARRAVERLVQRYPEVQLATLVSAPPEGEDWLHEIKFDGFRLLGFVAGGAGSLRTRNGKDWTDRFPALQASLEQLPVADAVLDMEAVVLGADGKSTFQELQSSLGADGKAVVGFAFDLIHLDGESLTSLPLQARKEKLQSLLKRSQAAALHFSDHLVGQGGALFTKACKRGLEGLISKRVNAPYVPGRHGDWLKTKCVQRQEFIILGYSNARRGSRALGALYLGYRVEGELRYAGKVGTGFSMQGASELAKRLTSIATSKATLARSAMTGVPAAEAQAIHWVKPVLLCEVAFTEWTRDGRIRHPSFQGIRDDKDAGEVVQERPLPVKSKTPSKSKTKTMTGARRAATAASSSLSVAGVAITHSERVISATGQITKGQLAEYYAAVAPVMLPGIVRRPVSLLRCPTGIDGECFYQRNPGQGLGPDVHAFPFTHQGKSFKYLYVEDVKGLLELVQMGAIELHPWGAGIDAIDRPDRLIFDLDPGAKVTFESVKQGAIELRARLAKQGLESGLKCTGGKGLHVTVPLAMHDEWGAVKSFARSVADEMMADSPKLYTATMSKAKRIGKVFIDYLRNDYTATSIADYAVRARPGAPVAVPLEWSELAHLQSSNQFTMEDVLQRVAGRRGGRKPLKAQRLPR